MAYISYNIPFEFIGIVSYNFWRNHSPVFKKHVMYFSFVIQLSDVIKVISIQFLNIIINQFILIMLF